MENASPMPEDASTRTARCSACGRPVWPATVEAASEDPPAPPELCDYCQAASR